MRGCKDAIREAPLCKLLGLCWRSWQPSVRRLVFAWIWLAGNSPLWCRKHCVSKCQQAVRCCVLFPAPHFASLVQHGDCFLMVGSMCTPVCLKWSPRVQTRIQTRFSAALVCFGDASYQQGTGLRRTSPGCPGAQWPC